MNLSAGWGLSSSTMNLSLIRAALSGDTCQQATFGSAPGQFQEPHIVAVDNSGGPSSGDVYVGDPTTDLISKTYQSSATTSDVFQWMISLRYSFR